MFLYLLAIIPLFFLLKFASKTSLLHILKKWLRLLKDKCYVYQYYKVPQFNHNMQENQLYRQISTYLNSLPCLEDSNFTNLFSGNKSNEINLVVDDTNQYIVDNFLGARACWINEKDDKTGLNSFVLKIRNKDKRRILRPYLQHIHTKFDEIEQRRNKVRLFININRRWISVPFTHPATFDTVVMEQDLKNKVKADLDTFLKSKQHYTRIGRIWKRNYLLYGPSGTGKSTFIAAMANFLSYDVYEINLSKVSNNSDLKSLLLQTRNKSLIVIEDLDIYLCDKSAALSSSAILNFMDGIFSCCGDERVMIFTMNNKDQIDQTVLRPGRIDFHIHFPLCDFDAFKSLATSHLGLKDHKLFPQVEEVFQTGSVLSPAEISEIMISNRSSPSRALKLVISAHQSNSKLVPSRTSDKIRTIQSNIEANMATKPPLWLSKSRSVRPVEESGVLPQVLSKSQSVRPVNELGDSCTFGKESVNELRKFYGLIRIRSTRKKSLDLDTTEKENPRHSS
ncbi:PREDICTED: AAA-ATPase At2g46620-like [Nicotiana attenuata]|uniref:Aaa-atpase n=1 Tax=Nicotiana attenuata TaxID=49451 RepID=A0A1J6IAK3_NICAT|nr:PREDICTED: AAA-ATPase At2g46620-like [Nicotiana attenuata]OIT02061.1 aaa-atpase [Nicotiana attenuata]